ncbi:MAG: transcriptional regulator, partial [Candidatus Dormibacteria bacterium]
AVTSVYPRQFLRGLIHSDGTRFMNPIRKRTRLGEYRYSYPRYMFSNMSDDIRNLFTDTCELLGVGWTQTRPNVIAVSRAKDVAFLDTFIGPKS